MRSRVFRRITCAIIRKDWTEYRYQILIITAGLFVPVLLDLKSVGSPDFVRGLKVGMIAASSLFFGQTWFHNERQRGTLDLLLALPTSGREILLAKYVSLCSAVLLAVNLPGLVLLDVRALFIANAFGLMLSVLFMATTIVSEKPWAPQIPLFAVMFLVLPLGQLLRRFHPEGLELYRAIRDNPGMPAIFAVIVTPLLIYISLWVFERKTPA